MTKAERLLIRAFPNVEYLLAFADGRPGGMRSHPEVYPLWNALVEAGR